MPLWGHFPRELREAKDEFVSRLSRLSSKKGTVSILIRDKDVARLMIHVQHIKEENLRDREEFHNKKANTSGNRSRQQKADNVNWSFFQQRPSGLSPSSSSAPAPKNKELDPLNLRVVWHKGPIRLLHVISVEETTKEH
ncbi:hypothetical protein H5410_060919, partial [Solanum commersonii]